MGMKRYSDLERRVLGDALREAWHDQLDEAWQQLEQERREPAFRTCGYDTTLDGKDDNDGSIAREATPPN